MGDVRFGRGLLLQPFTTLEEISNRNARITGIAFLVSIAQQKLNPLETLSFA
jgi:hypothetical protein